MEEAALRKLIRATLGLAFLATFTLANTANAAAVLAFSAGGGVGTKTATANGTTSTTLTTNSVTPGFAGGFPVSVGTIGNITLIPFPIPGNPNAVFTAREAFTNVTSVGNATLSGNTIQQAFSGTISYTDPSNVAINFLTINFTNGLLRGTAGGQTVSLSGDNSVPGQTVTFTSTDPRVTPFLTDPIKNFAIDLTGLQFASGTGLSLTGNTITGFTATNQGGNVSSFAVPEPTSVVMAGTAVLVGLGCFRWRRSGNRSV